MGGNSVINPLGHNFLGTGGTAINRPLSAAATWGGSEFTKTNPFGVPINNPLARVFGNGQPNSNPYVSGPFSLDQNQVAADQASILGLGTKQYNDTLAGIDANSEAQKQYASDTLNRMTPGIEEGLNSQHLLNSTALQQELGRQASYLANDVASQNAQQKQAALTGRQGFEQSSLGRGLNLEDFINQANVAKSIGAQIAPQVPSGKGSALGGLGAGAAAGAPFGPWGAGIGAGLGFLAGGGLRGR